MRWAKPILLMVVLLVASSAAFAQCAMCRTGLTNSPEGQRLANGFNSGILFLLSAPFVVVGTIAFLIFRPHLRRALLAAAGQAHRGAISQRQPWGGRHDNHIQAGSSPNSSH